MNYKELVFTLLNPEEYQHDLLIDSLSQIGFDTFEVTDFGFKAYIPAENFNEELLIESLSDYQEMFSFSYEINLIPHKNWNEVWESNFEPLTISDKCYVRATFHPARPEFPYEIVIDPKMAFGTGHHQTTSMMIQWMLEDDFADKKVLDMGCGTGILAILAKKLGASKILAIDYDPLCFDSTIENTALNNTSDIKVLCGSKEVIPNEKFDIIIANINRNILLDQLDRYSEVLNDKGIIYLSGFYDGKDLDMIRQKAETLNLKFIGKKTDKDWVAAKFLRGKIDF
ncbi:MAG: 50S ribosomal protein L11 methyltransferase [Daejeonella sp.]